MKQLNIENTLLVTNARLIDGTGSEPVESQSILIENGRFSRIDRNISVDGVRVIDAAGATVLPGLIDAHVHLESVPGSYYRDDSDEQLWEYRKHQLRAYPACGVTTVLDNAISARQLRQFREHFDAGGVGPRVFALAPLFYPPGGYGDAVEMRVWGPFSSTGTPEEVETRFREYEEFDNIVGVKMTLEPGMGPSRVWAVHSREMRKIIADAAEKRGLPVHVHALKPREQQEALDMGATRLVHAGFFTDSPSEAFLRELKQKGIYVTTTLASTVGQNLMMFHLDELDDPLLRLTVPAQQLETAGDPAAWRETMFKMFKICSPKWMPGWIIRLMLKMADLEKDLTARLESSSRAIFKMHEAGIPIVAGTDSANWPLFLNYFHGPSSVLELEMLQRAGLSPLDILSSATRIPAEMMGKADELGTVEVGKRGDLVIVDGDADPLQDLRALRNLAWCIKDGEARTPGQWMSA